MYELASWPRKPDDSPRVVTLGTCHHRRSTCPQRDACMHQDLFGPESQPGSDWRRCGPGLRGAAAYRRRRHRWWSRRCDIQPLVAHRIAGRIAPNPPGSFCVEGVSRLKPAPSIVTAPKDHDQPRLCGIRGQSRAPALPSSAVVAAITWISHENVCLSESLRSGAPARPVEVPMLSSWRRSGSPNR